MCIFSLLFSISCWCSVRMPTWIASCFGRYVLSAIHVHCEFWLVILHWEGGGLESEKLCPCWGFQVFLFFFTACVTICSNRLNDIRNICQICESKNTIIICQNLNYLSPVCWWQASARPGGPGAGVRVIWVMNGSGAGSRGCTSCQQSWKSPNPFRPWLSLPGLSCWSWPAGPAVTVTGTVLG